MLTMLLLLGCADEPLPECVVQVDHEPAGDNPHVSGGIDYDDPPPTSGEHDPCWAPWGVHAEEIPDERWVHNLEHGGVVFLYDCPDGCEAELAELEALTTRLEILALLTPYAELPTRFGAVAWEDRILLDCLNTEVLEQFYLQQVNRAPESVLSDPSESCM